MKKLLILSTALAGVAMMSAPASAALTMKMGGFFRGYGVYSDSNDGGTGATATRNYDMKRDSEVHFNGENTLDNGLTIGYHGELKTLNDASSASSAIDESYAYASGGWGRVNLGSADGSAYLLQVAAPSADSNVDGMRVFIASIMAKSRQGTDSTAGAGGTALNPTAWTGVAGTAPTAGPALDYQHADFRQSERITYMTPKFNGFQAGVSYAAKNGMNAIGSNTAAPDYDAESLTTYNNLWEGAARWDGEFQGFGISLGGGYSDSSMERDPTTAEMRAVANQSYYFVDGIKSYNGGLNVAFQGFSLGGDYKRTQLQRKTDGDAGNAASTEFNTGDVNRDTWTVGLGYDNGPWHAGTSYLHQTTDYKAIANTVDADIAGAKFTNTKYTVGGGYTYGPGMTFRGSVAWGKYNAPTAFTGAEDNRFSQVSVGTNIAF